jgi:hypothetical protein
MGSIAALSIVVAAALLLTSAAEAQSIEERYSAPGPFAVEHITTPPCDREGNLCDLYVPRSDEGERAEFPVISWGNGTDKTPSPPGKYEFLLRHLASWGFIVVATRDGATGSGETVLDAARFAGRAGSDAGSPIFGKVAAGPMGAAGHSQGASGAANAMLKSRGAVQTAVLFHLPQQAFCDPAPSCLSTADLTAARSGSLFYVSGSKDFIISPDWLPGGGGKLNSLRAYYEATPSGLVKAKAILNGGDHNDLLGRPDCPGGQFGCSAGVSGYLGYPTAWLVWRLNGDDLAGAFSQGGELQRSRNWAGVRTNVRTGSPRGAEAPILEEP